MFNYLWLPLLFYYSSTYAIIVAWGQKPILLFHLHSSCHHARPLPAFSHLSKDSSGSTWLVILNASLIMWIWEGEAWSFVWSHLEGLMLLQSPYLPRIRSSSPSRTLVLCRTLKFCFFSWVINESLYSSFWLLCSHLPCRVPLPPCLLLYGHSSSVTSSLVADSLWADTFPGSHSIWGDLKQSSIVHTAGV